VVQEDRERLFTSTIEKRGGIKKVKSIGRNFPPVPLEDRGKKKSEEDQGVMAKRRFCGEEIGGLL